jgi:hypothetical protein
VLLVGSGALKNINDLIGSRPRNFPACRIALPPPMLQLILQLINTINKAIKKLSIFYTYVYVCVCNNNNNNNNSMVLVR